MSLQVIVYVLTALAGLVVVLTRLRLRGQAGAGRHRIGSGLVNVHTLFGVLALGTWVGFLVAPQDSAAGGSLVGIVALGFWWIAVIAGLMLLIRWMPSRGRHATGAVEHSWSAGPWLSVLAHVGLLVGVLVFTWAYVTAAV